MRIYHFLDYWAREQPDAEFAIQEGQGLTYAEAAATVNRLAQGMVKSGVQVGDRVAILATNRPELVLLLLAAAKAGVVAIPMDSRQTANQWLYVINDGQVKTLFSAGEFISAVDGLRPSLETVEHFVAIDDAERGNGWESYGDWLVEQPATPIERPVADADAMFQVYTSGTTGQPKGVVVSHGACMAMLDTIEMQFTIQPGERFLVVTPIFHASGLICSFLSVAKGCSIYMPRGFDPVEAVRALSEERISGTFMAPAMILACLGVPGAAERRYDTLRFISYGAAAISVETLTRATQVFPCGFLQVYGLTEALPVTFLSMQDHQTALTDKPELLTSAGRPALAFQIRIVDEEGQTVPTGSIGEIIVSGPGLMTEYWNRPEATAETLRDGWLYTGDAGYLDEEGYLYIRDRIKDLILWSGR
ncbi:MAG: AMP-binding protein, partial [Chloroflexi bacterium]|nr:AMP-binding protein [Chloroflexota bacterium]